MVHSLCWSQWNNDTFLHLPLVVLARNNDQMKTRLKALIAGTRLNNYQNAIFCLEFQWSDRYTRAATQSIFTHRIILNLFQPIKKVTLILNDIRRTLVKLFCVYYIKALSSFIVPKIWSLLDIYFFIFYIFLLVDYRKLEFKKILNKLLLCIIIRKGNDYWLYLCIHCFLLSCFKLNLWKLSVSNDCRNNCHYDCLKLLYSRIKYYDNIHWRTSYISLRKWHHIRI